MRMAGMKGTVGGCSAADYCMQNDGVHGTGREEQEPAKGRLPHHHQASGLLAPGLRFIVVYCVARPWCCRCDFGGGDTIVE
uniref:Uncharacterized protein n=1 Tax=Arundo donax TaxID=35708 RepID=A0A0A9FWT2_ARUDO